MKVLFLDIDGVLNSHDFWKRCKELGVVPDDKVDPLAVERLNRLTDETGAKIVVSSTWRLPYVWSKKLYSLIGRLQKLGITGEIVGMTPDHCKAYGRGGEIQDWMDNCQTQIDSFVILDDDDNDMDHLMDYLVQTKMTDGLQDHHVETAIQILNK